MSCTVFANTPTTGVELATWTPTQLASVEISVEVGMLAPPAEALITVRTFKSVPETLSETCMLYVSGVVEFDVAMSREVTMTGDDGRTVAMDREDEPLVVEMVEPLTVGAFAGFRCH